MIGLSGDDTRANSDPASAGSLPSPVLRALRFAGEEVQFGLVLASICQQAEVAAALADAIINRARFGNAAARRRARRPHDDVRCLGEQQLQARVTRRLSRARAKDVGRVDLLFEGSNSWRLAAELKLNSDFGPAQLERYSDWGPVAAVVRDSSKVAPMKENPSWIGAASWRSLVEDLRSLPVDARWQRDWLGLVDIMEADGDFDVDVPSSREEQAQVELLESLASPLVEHLATELTRVHKARAKTAASGLKSTAVRRGRGWAGVGISAQDGALIWIAIRNLWSPAPRLAIEHYTFPDWHAKRRLEKAHARIEALGFGRRGDTFRFEQPVARLSEAHEAETMAVISGLLTTLVEARVFDVEIDRLERRYGSR